MIVFYAIELNCIRPTWIGPYMSPDDAVMIISRLPAIPKREFMIVSFTQWIGPN